MGTAGEDSAGPRWARSSGRSLGSHNNDNDNDNDNANNYYHSYVLIELYHNTIQCSEV